MSGLLGDCRARGGEMTELLAELTRIESPSTDADAVARLARRVAQELEPLGLSAELLLVEGGGPILRASRGERPVMLLGHMDTVWDAGTLATRPVRIESGRLFGPGAYDMKGGIIALVHALKALARNGPLPDVRVFLTPLEEVGAGRYRGRMEQEMRSCRAVLGFEPAWPGGAVKTRRKGAATLLLRARGIAAHAGADPTRGCNAILELARRLLDASELTDVSRGLTVSVGTIHGGTRSNVVPEEAHAQLDLRFGTLSDFEAVRAAVETLAPSDERARLELEVESLCPPLERGPHVVATFRAAARVAQELGLPPLEEAATGGGSEASFAAAMGIPTLDGLGPDGNGAHAEHEHVLLSSLPDRAALAAGLILRLSRP
jgi:glutamate carboxypeptidase